jgi:hypothetical protein
MIVIAWCESEMSSGIALVVIVVIESFAMMAEM